MRKSDSIMIPESVGYIGFCAFEDCQQLQHLEVPAGVTSWGQFTFKDCGKLQWKKIEDSKEYKATSNTEHTDTDTTAGKVYYYKVLAVHENSSANSAYSSVDSIEVE